MILATSHNTKGLFLGLMEYRELSRKWKWTSRDLRKEILAEMIGKKVIKNFMLLMVAFIHIHQVQLQ